MPAHGLLLIAPVRAGMEESLRIILNQLGNDIRGVRTPELATAVRIEFTPLDVVRRAILAAAEVTGLMAGMGIREVLGAALQINATLNRVWWIRLGNLLFRNRPTVPPHRHSQAEPHSGELHRRVCRDDSLGT